jgi:hypothetical protein
VIVDAHHLRISASLGVAVCEAIEKPKGWVRRADAALYFAKGRGRNCVAYYYGGNCLPFGDRPTASKVTTNVQTETSDPTLTPEVMPEVIDYQRNDTESHVSALPADQLSDSAVTPIRSAEEMLEAEVHALKLESAKARVARRLDAIVREEQQRR